MSRINHFGILLACLAFCACALAQSQDNPYPMPPRTVLNGPPTSVPTPAARPAPRPAPQPAKPSPATPVRSGVPSRPVPPSMLNQPAGPASVILASGKLTIEAHNSSLSRILDQIARTGGMKITGLPASASSQRIFGKYGPGAPREVLSDLLTGSGYNVLMVGVTPAGTPRELALSVRAPGGVPNPPPSASQDNEDQDIQPTEYPDDQEPQQQELQEQQPDQPPPGPQNRIRTPEQILQELQRMRRQQQQQQSR